jgi:hypothetical protein
MKKVVTIFVLFMVLTGVACQTNFTGSPVFPGGSKGCFNKCNKLNMEMAAYTYVGEFSTACSCKVKYINKSSGSYSQTSFIPGVVGVVMQQRRNAKNQQKTY